MLPFDDRDDIIKCDRLEALFQISPEFATFCGYHVLDDQLSHVAKDDVDGEMRFLKEWLADLKKLSGLAKDQQLDLALFEQGYAIQRFFIEDVRGWERMPDAIGEIGQALFMTLIYDAPDEEKRFMDIAARLEQLPRYVKEHQSRIIDPPARWRDIALQTTATMPNFFDAVVEAARAKAPPKLTEWIGREVARAKEETAAYRRWLEALAVDETESWVLGPERFAELIRLRQLGLGPSDILELGYEYLGKHQAELTRLMGQVAGTADIEAARAKIERSAPPDFAAALETTRRVCAEAKQFLQQRKLVPLPEQEALEVVETPPFMRPILPFAAVFAPARFDRAQRGIYLMTPPANSGDLGKHLNYPTLYNLAVHEAYPGHHVQLSTANTKTSFLRSTPVAGGKAMETVEGWAHYCEELMTEHGFHDTPEGRFIMVSGLVWRACRIIIDVRLSQGEMSYDEGVQMLVQQARLPEAAARAELNRYTQSPGYQLSYLIGKHLIGDLKKAVKEREKGRFSELDFHTRFLNAGSIPISFIRKHTFSL